MDPSKPVGRGAGVQPPPKGQEGPPKDARLSYFRDNIQDPHELDDYDPSEYYYQRDKAAAAAAAASGGTFVPGAMPPPIGAYYPAPPGTAGASQSFVSPGPHTMPPTAIAGRPNMPQHVAGPIGPMPVQPQGSAAMNQVGFNPSSAMGVLRGFLSAPPGNAPAQSNPAQPQPSQPFQMPPQSIAQRSNPPPPSPRRPTANQAQMSIAITANVQNAPRGLNPGQQQPPQPQPTQPTPQSAPQPVRAPAPDYRQATAQPTAPRPIAPSYSAAAVNKTPSTTEEKPFDPSEFPSLQGFPGTSPPTTAQRLTGSLVDQKPDFSIHNAADFPALGDETNGPELQLLSSASAIPVSSSATDAPTVAGQWQKPFSRPIEPQPSTKSQPSRPAVEPTAANRYGLLGLLGVIRMSEPDHTTLALGTDLTALGLNLNSPELLYESFASPWSDSPSRHEPDYTLPACYYLQPPLAPPMNKLPFVTDETLFYIFYSIPMEGLQMASAKELCSRDWRYHKELKLWFQRVPDTDVQKKGNAERGSYAYFDLNTWERVQKDNLTLALDQLVDTAVLESMSNK